MIYDVLPVNNYQGNNSATTFDFDFYIEDGSQLKVYYFDENSVKTLLTENLDYSINEVKNTNGSYITFPLAGSDYEILKENERISLELSLPISQDTQYNNSSLLNLEALEYSLDYLTRLIQIYARKIELCVKVEECSENTPEELMNTINQQSLSATNNANSAQAALSSVIQIKSSIDSIYNYILSNHEKFDEIDTLVTKTNQLEQDLLTKADTDLSNLTDGISNVICTSKPGETSTASSNSPVVMVENYTKGNSWYRVYSDGWCEQGGIIPNPLKVSFGVTLIKNFANINYSVFAVTSGSDATNCHCPNILSKTVGQFVAISNYLAYPNRTIEWHAYGYVI